MLVKHIREPECVLHYPSVTANQPSDPGSLQPHTANQSHMHTHTNHRPCTNPKHPAICNLSSCIHLCTTTTKPQIHGCLQLQPLKQNSLIISNHELAECKNAEPVITTGNAYVHRYQNDMFIIWQPKHTGRRKPIAAHLNSTMNSTLSSNEYAPRVR